MQRNLRLCIKRDLTEHDIVSRIMRKDNYLIGALGIASGITHPHCQYGMHVCLAIWLANRQTCQIAQRLIRLTGPTVWVYTQSVLIAMQAC